MVRGEDHIGFKFKGFIYTLGAFLKEKDSKMEIKDVIYKVVKGVKELHELGYTHSMLTLGHVLVDDDSKEVLIRGFSKSVPSSATDTH